MKAFNNKFHFYQFTDGSYSDSKICMKAEQFPNLWEKVGKDDLQHYFDHFLSLNNDYKSSHLNRIYKAFYVLDLRFKASEMDDWTLYNQAKEEMKKFTKVQILVASQFLSRFAFASGNESRCYSVLQDLQDTVMDVYTWS